MSNDGQVKKKRKITLNWILIGYIICIIAIIGATFSIIYKKSKKMPNAIDFTIDNELDNKEGSYAYLEVQGLTKEISTVHENSESIKKFNNDKYYIAFNKGYWYVVNLDSDTIDMLKDLQDYTYSTDENATIPETVKIYGMTEKIPDDLKQILINFYNDGVEEENQIDLENFDLYFGNVLLNVKKKPININLEKMIIIISIVVIFIMIISVEWKKIRTKKP